MTRNDQFDATFTKKNLPYHMCLWKVPKVTRILSFWPKSLDTSYDAQLYTKPNFTHYTLVFVGVALWTVWHFYLQRLLWHTERKMSTKQIHIDHGNSGDGNQYDVTTDQNANDASKPVTTRQVRSRRKREH